jgi:mannose-6-phosphate isomerase
MAREARRWLFAEAAPLWSTTGRTQSGLFAERISMSGVADPAYFRTFVQARHVVSFASMGRLGWDGDWASLITETTETLLSKARRTDGLFVHRLDGHGQVRDGRADLYDQAFILLALATAGGALRRPLLFDHAEALLGQIEGRWSEASGGFAEGEIWGGSVRRQNPHMHLLEAFIALFQESGRDRFLGAATNIADLAARAFVDRGSGALLEYFSHDLTPALGPEGRIAEPGHCFEWAWLFERLASLGWLQGHELSDALTMFGRDTGIDQARGVAINEVLVDGSVRDSAARLWPQTERLKAAASRYWRLQSLSELNEISAAYRGLVQYFDVPVGGLWRDKLLEKGGWVEEHAPGSSLYHITCAFQELISIAEQCQQAGSVDSQ